MIDLGITPLTGTSSPLHMQQDLQAAMKWEPLTSEELAAVKGLIGEV